MKIHTVYDYNDPDFDIYKDGEEGDMIHFLPNNQEGIRYYRIVMKNGQRELEDTTSSPLEKKTKKRKTRRSVVVKARDRKRKNMKSKRVKISE